MCPAQLEHGLYILPVKRGFDSDFVRMIGIDELYGPLKNKFELGIGVVIFSEHQLVHLHKVHLFVDDLDNTKPHDRGAGVYAQYNFFCCQINRCLGPAEA